MFKAVGEWVLERLAILLLAILPDMTDWGEGQGK